MNMACITDIKRLEMVHKVLYDRYQQYEVNSANFQFHSPKYAAGT